MELNVPKLIFKQPDGSEKSIEAENGLSLMEVARDNNLGIEGTCGGSISCCTCHVIVDDEWFSIVGKHCNNIEFTCKLFGVTFFNVAL